MENKDYTTTITVNATAKETFNAINNVAQWWTGDLTGNSQKVGDEFTVRFDDIHVSTQRVVELIPNQKVVWLVTKSKLNFIKNKSEWNDTKISFEISSEGDKTRIHFTHHGLAPNIECYTDCSGGWDYYIKGSLLKLLNKGQGTPGLM